MEGKVISQMMAIDEKLGTLYSINNSYEIQIEVLIKEYKEMDSEIKELANSLGSVPEQWQAKKIIARISNFSERKEDYYRKAKSTYRKLKLNTYLIRIRTWHVVLRMVFQGKISFSKLAVFYREFKK
ncbi:hypothetical protein ACWN97_09745 [Pediococcus acidilactici]|uniref:hypothetical protein n=1 Tax=Lactobacillaceae TaxID=33958 RepID=UPI0013222A1F|nr:MULTISPECIES: hypothetical protein [Lactobacillaceae]KAF0468801.1 hypothetical protein GBP06_09670 [Pediococcus acidilactici]KAF0539787.1 hypothetical protein GBP40_09760 [Pediococcus acidilactici]WPQ68980.1 hypothetical protein QRX23_09995 [Weissella paramesenteroides]